MIKIIKQFLSKFLNNSCKFSGKVNESRSDLLRYLWEEEAKYKALNDGLCKALGLKTINLYNPEYPTHEPEFLLGKLQSKLEALNKIEILIRNRLRNTYDSEVIGVLTRMQKFINGDEEDET